MLDIVKTTFLLVVGALFLGPSSFAALPPTQEIVVHRARTVSDALAEPVVVPGIQTEAPDAGFERLSRIESEFQGLKKSKPLKKRARAPKKPREEF
jgi:hypothetical protein